MRGGQNRKTIEQHIEDGTYRPNRHGYVAESDDAALKEMKGEIYSSFKKVQRETAKINLATDNANYKRLCDITIALAKAYHSIAKTPVENRQETSNDKDGFKE